MRVIYHIPGSIVGGAETQVQYLVNNLPVFVTPLITYEHPGMEKFLFSNFPNKSIKRIFSPNDLSRKVHEFKPNIIQFYHSPSFYKALSRISTPAKVVEVAHNRAPFPWDCTTYPKDRTDVLVCVSPDAKDNYLMRRGNDVPIELIPNGVDTIQFCPPTEPKPKKVRLLGGFCGRLEDGDGKGVESLVKIVSKLPVDFELVGYDFGNYRQKTKGMRNISVHRHTTSMHEYYHKWDFFVSCSPREGFGLAIAEAMACGLPCVILNCGGICHYIKHKRHAYIAEGLSDVVVGIQHVIDGELFKPLEVNFSAEKMVDSYLDLYDKLLKKDAANIGVETEKRKINFVSELPKREFVLGVVPKGWQGIRHSLESKVHEIVVPEDAIKVAEEKKATSVIFGGFQDRWYIVAKTIKERTRAQIIITVHGTAVMNEFGDENRAGLVHAIACVKEGIASHISTPHEGLARALNTLHNVEATFEPNRVSPISVGRVTKLDGLHIGLFGTGLPWKNWDTQILAAASTPNMECLHVQNLRYTSLIDQLGIKYKIEPYFYNRSEFYCLAGSMRINLAVGLTETFGFFGLESFMLGTPAIVSATTPSFRGAKGKLRKCIVNYIDDPSAISDAILDVLDEYDEIVAEGEHYCKQLILRV